MEEKVIKPAGYWAKYGVWFIIISVILLVLSVVSLILDYNAGENIIIKIIDIILVCLLAILCFETIGITFWLQPRLKVVFDNKNNINIYHWYKDKPFRSVNCKDVVSFTKTSLTSGQHFLAKDGTKLVTGPAFYSKNQIKEIIQEIQKRGGLKDYKIDF